MFTDEYLPVTNRSLAMAVSFSSRLQFQLTDFLRIWKEKESGRRIREMMRIAKFTVCSAGFPVAVQQTAQPEITYNVQLVTISRALPLAHVLAMHRVRSPSIH